MFWKEHQHVPERAKSAHTRAAGPHRNWTVCLLLCSRQTSARSACCCRLPGRPFAHKPSTSHLTFVRGVSYSIHTNQSVLPAPNRLSRSCTDDAGDQEARSETMGSAQWRRSPPRLTGREDSSTDKQQRDVDLGSTVDELGGRNELRPLPHLHPNAQKVPRRFHRMSINHPH